MMAVLWIIQELQGKKMRQLVTGLVISITLVLAGCAAVLVGGTAAGVSVVHDRRDSMVVFKDKKIEFAAIARLRENKDLNPNVRVRFTSYNQVVLITGQVFNVQEREQIQQQTQSIPDVSKVVNELTVADPATFEQVSRDMYLVAKVNLALFNLGLPDFDPTRVKVVAELGTIYLMGLLTPGEVDTVVRQVRKVDGVRQVVALFEQIQV